MCNISNLPKQLIVSDSLLLRLITDHCIKLTKFFINLPHPCGKTKDAIRDQIEIISNTTLQNCFKFLFYQLRQQAGTPQQLAPITAGPELGVNFAEGGNRSARRKPSKSG